MKTSMFNYFIRLNNLLKQDKHLVQARIIKQTGSSPRSIGTKCIILEDGSIVGSIGGGILEHNVIERAKNIFSTGEPEFYHYQFLGDDTDNIEMVCGGTMDVYLEPIFPEHEQTRTVFNKICGSIRSGKQCKLYTKIGPDVSSDKTSRLLIEENESYYGSIPGLDILEDLLSLKRDGLYELEDKNVTLYAETIMPDDVLLLIGGGHVAFYLAPIVKMLGFHLVVIDDRNEFANSERFPDADEIKIISFADLSEHIHISYRTYIVIMTRGHAHDQTVLGQVIHSRATYIGMIASRRKKKVVFESLINEGCPNEKLEQVRSPIGLDINAETPQEIAISIAAELVKIRSLNRIAVQ